MPHRGDVPLCSSGRAWAQRVHGDVDFEMLSILMPKPGLKIRRGDAVGGCDALSQGSRTLMQKDNSEPV